MKKKVFIIAIMILCIILIVGIYWIYQNNNQENMDYKFESDKLYVTTNNKDWIEVPYDFSLTIKHLQETNNGEYKEGTYQLNNQKMVFYLESETVTTIYDQEGNVVNTLPNFKYATHLIYSDDRGKNWNDVIIGTSDYLDMLANIEFEDKDNGKAILKSRDDIGYYAYVTNDGGQEWDSVTTEEIKNYHIDLKDLEEYTENELSEDDAIQLLEKIKADYKNYLTSSTENGESTGLYLYFSNDVESNSEEIKNKAINSMIDDYINTIKSGDTGTFEITLGIDDNNRQYIYVLKTEKASLEGDIIEVGENYILVQESESGNTYRVNADIATNQFINYRTEQNMDISDVKIGDYYINSFKGKTIIRNISGEEWKNECIKNLAYCYTEGNLSCNPIEITNVENMGNYVIITLIMGDSSTQYFRGKDNIDTFELKAIANADLNIPTSSGDVTVYNLKEEVEGFMFWIGLDENTINNEYPTINNIEIYDK